MSNLLRNLRYALRQLLRTPAFSLTVILSLALGIGGTVAIFSLTDAVLLRPLQFKNEARLISVFENRPKLGLLDDTPAPANFYDWKTRNHVFSDMAAAAGTLFAITGNGRPEEVEGTQITANLLPVLGVKPLLGRNFRPEEDQPGARAVALISAGLWRRRLGSDPQVIGKTIRLNGEPYNIAGVMPFGFTFHENSQIWVPLALSVAERLDRDNHYLLVYGLLRPHVTLAAARSDMLALSKQLEQRYPATNTGLVTSLHPLREELVGKVQSAIFVLAVGVTIILLITCANIAGLMIARSTARQRETAVKAALGASSSRLFGEHLLESALLSCVGAGLGLLLAAGSIPLLEKLVPLSLASWARPEMNWRALAFALGTCFLVAAAFALMSHRFVTADGDGALRQGRGTVTGDKRVVRSALVAGQVALATVVLVATVLLGETFWKLAHADLGFSPQHVLTMRTDLPVSDNTAYRNFEARSSFYARVIENVEHVPGVISAGYTTFLPLTNGGGSSTILIEGALPLRVGESNDVLMRIVTPDYFRSVGARLLSGRVFNERDNRSESAVAVINAAMARKYWGSQNPLGRRFRFDDPHSPVVTVIGVVGDVRQVRVDAAPSAEMYFSYLQDLGPGYFRPRDLAVRVSGDPAAYVHSVRNAIWSVDPEEPISDIQTLQHIVDNRLATYDIEAKLFGWFAIASLLLSSIGIYGLLSYDVARRTREIGLRMALGAERATVLQHFVGGALRLAFIGILAGALVSLLLADVLAGVLYGVAGSDLGSRLSAGLVLVTVTLLAAYLPARRAARVDPMEALRAE